MFTDGLTGALSLDEMRQWLAERVSEKPHPPAKPAEGVSLTSELALEPGQDVLISNTFCRAHAYYSLYEMADDEALQDTALTYLTQAYYGQKLARKDYKKLKKNAVPDAAI